jgi:hypothetical protein
MAHAGDLQQANEKNKHIKNHGPRQTVLKRHRNGQDQGIIGTGSAQSVDNHPTLSKINSAKTQVEDKQQQEAQ